MPLKSVLDSLDGLSDEAKTFYRSGEEVTKGRFILDIEAVDGFALENVEGLKGALSTVKTEAEKSTKALEAYKGLPAASTLRDKLKKLEKLEAFDVATEAGRRAEQIFEREAAEAAERHQANTDELKAVNGRYWTALNSALIASAAKDAISKENGSAALLMPHVMQRAKVDPETLKVSIIRDDGLPQIRSNGHPASMTDLIVELRDHPDLGRAFERDDVKIPTVAAARSVPPRPRDGSNLTTYMATLKTGASR